MSDYDKQHWQEQQAAQDAALTKQREKWAKTKARAARNAQRKITRLSKKLSESGDLTEWEEEFAGSVSERLDKFGSAFQDPQLGRPADALSFSQKKVVAALNKKAKDQKTKARASENNEAEPAEKPDYKPRSSFKPKSGFKSKKTYTPRIRQIEDDLPKEDDEPYIPEYSEPQTDGPKRPFLRIVK